MICSIEKDANCGEGGGEAGEPRGRPAVGCGCGGATLVLVLHVVVPRLLLLLLAQALGLRSLAREGGVRRVRRRLDVAVARVAAAYADLRTN